MPSRCVTSMMHMRAEKIDSHTEQSSRNLRQQSCYPTGQQNCLHEFNPQTEQHSFNPTANQLQS